jgi:hypothetical protein
MATYKDIRTYVKRLYGFASETCWIAHVKGICGIPVKITHNRRTAKNREKPCPPEKMDAIKDAFIHFKMI